MGRRSTRSRTTFVRATRASRTWGGALRLKIAEAAKLRIASATFANNVATNGNGLPGTRDVQVTNSIFAQNKAEAGSQQVDFVVGDGGGNILWPAPQGSSTLPAASSTDPMLADITAAGSSWARVPAGGSPAIDMAVNPAPTVDQRGARRTAKPDVGSYEVGAACAAR